MTTARYQGIERDENLAIVPGATIYVLDLDGATLSTLADDSGNSLPNPLTSDSLGVYYFNAALGVYWLYHYVNGRPILKETVGVGVADDYQYRGPIGPAGPAGQPGYKSLSTWAALNATTGTAANEAAHVEGVDAGTHTDPVVGGTVANAGRYAWSVSPAGWKWVAGLDTGPLLTPEAFGAIAYATRTAAEAGVDSGAAFDAMLATWYANGGGTIFLSGWYRTGRAFLLQNTNSLTTIGHQPPLRITGTSGHAVQNGQQPDLGTGIVWTSETGTAVAKIDTRGLGLLVLDNCSLASSQSSGNTKPFVHTTFTTIQTGVGLSISGAIYGASAVEDAFVLGGRTSYETDPTFDRRSSDCGFQGYGTHITHVGCNGIRRLAVGQRYCNGVWITHNTVWNTCGNNSSTGGAIEFDGSPIAPTAFAVGGQIGPNLIEVTSYKRAVYLKNCAKIDVIANDCYDATSLTTEAVYVDASCQNIFVKCGVSPAGKPYLTDPSTVAMVIGNEASLYDRLNSLACGISGYPNLFGPTTFTDPIGTKFQSAGATGGGALINVLRGLADTDPGGVVFRMTGNGRMDLGGGSETGTITNNQSGGAQWLNRGKDWSCSDGAGGVGNGDMSQNSGPGGNTYTAKNFRFTWTDHTGAVLGCVDSQGGGIGAPGIRFGATFDTGLYRYSSTVIKSDQKVVAATGIGVGNSASATTLGTLSKKMEVFDATGSSLGFVPIYTTIT